MMSYSCQRQEVVTVGISTSSKDVCVRHFVVAIVHHVQLGGQLYRRKPVVTVLPGKQTWERAWFYGLRMVAHYVNLQTPVVIHVTSTRAWEAWTLSKHREVFYDMTGLITLGQRRRIKALTITPAQLKEMPKTEWSLRHHMADAKKVAVEVALSTRQQIQESGTSSHPAHSVLARRQVPLPQPSQRKWKSPPAADKRPEAETLP